MIFMPCYKAGFFKYNNNDREREREGKVDIEKGDIEIPLFYNIKDVSDV